MREIIVVLINVALVDNAKADKTILKSCCEVSVKGDSHFNTPNIQSGVYNIIDLCFHAPLIQGYCDAITDGGGWLVVQRRKLHGNENFHRSWLDYERGFGDLNSEFWYGLRSLHCLTSKGTWELRIDFTFTNGTKSYLHYNKFKVGPPTDNYTLSISGITGITPTDPFATFPLNGQQFTTYDRDNDVWSDGNCAVKGHGSKAPGGWWYNKCFHINLNYNHGGPHGFMYLTKYWYSIPFIEMKIHPTNCNY